MTAYVLTGLVQAKGCGVRGRRGPHRSRPQVAADTQFTQSRFGKDRPARVHGVCAGAQRQRLERDDRGFCLEPAIHAHSLRQGIARAWRWRRSTTRAPTTWRSSCRRRPNRIRSQAWWPTDTNYLMDFYGDTTPQATAYALKLLERVDPQSPLLPKAALVAGDASRRGLLLGLDRTDGHGRFMASPITCSARRS